MYQPLLELNDLTRMYDALQGMSPYEIEQLTHEGSSAHLSDEENLRRLQWQDYLSSSVNSVGSGQGSPAISARLR